MTQELVEGTLNDLPHSEETRDLVAKWLHSFEQNLGSDKQSKNSESNDGRSKFGFEGDRSSSEEEVEGRTPVSIMNQKMIPKNKRLGSTVSHDGPQVDSLIGRTR